ncbi:MAG: undecaprenyl-phosphate glucose phosphotransferase [Pseudomonadota bacterium]|nr:undecaprenyl-phosphate glucose phosphotransferase [Pseudomonadota bacterium]
MSAVQASRLSARRDQTAFRRTESALSRSWARTGAGEPPSIALIKEHLNSAIVAGTLLLAAMSHGQEFNSLYITLAVFAYAATFKMMTRPRLELAGSALDWGRMLRHRMIEWACVIGILLLAGFLLKVSSLFSRRVMLTWFVLTPFILTAAHAAARKFAGWLLEHGGTRRRQVIVGANRVGCELAARLAEEPWHGNVEGFFDDRRVDRLPRESRPFLLGRFSDLPEYARQNQVHVIYVCLPISKHPRIRALLDALGDTTASIYFVPDLSAFDLMQARFGEVGGMPLVAVRETPFCGMTGVLKRTSDIVLAAGALLLAAPVMAVIAIRVRQSSPGPVFFRQRRYGLDGREFVVYKFRTMTVCEDDPLMQATRFDLRVTPVGAFLRRTSLDELPQLLNVLGGSMSLVGPRPHAVAHNEHYRKLVSGYMLRHKVRPGITGLAQVNGMRGETSDVEKMNQRVQLDLEYLKHWSLGLDIRILLKTVSIVLRDQNAY